MSAGASCGVRAPGLQAMLMAIHKATVAARERTGKRIAVRVERGQFEIVEVESFEGVELATTLRSPVDSSQIVALLGTL